MENGMVSRSANSPSVALENPALTVNLAPGIFVSGGSIAGEVEIDYQVVVKNGFEHIYVELQGTIQT